MSYTQKIQALKQEIYRLQTAKQSKFARHIDIANLVDARDKLRVLEREAKASLSENKSLMP